MRGATEERAIVRFAGEGLLALDDVIAVEEPLEIRLGSERWLVTMRTPGHDHDLALGLLYSEGIVSGLADVGKIVHCGDPTGEGYGNVIDVLPGPGAHFRWAPEERRSVPTASSCGVCGRRTIADLLERVAARRSDERAEVSIRLLLEAASELGLQQPGYRSSGGMHAAAVALIHNGDVSFEGHAEDVGRHNAVDKVVGALLHSRKLRELAGRVLVVSGRLSFDIVQKAAMAGFAVVAAIGAPSTLAIDLAERAGITLCGFIRDGHANVYTHPERVKV